METIGVVFAFIGFAVTLLALAWLIATAWEFFAGLSAADRTHDIRLNWLDEQVKKLSARLDALNKSRTRKAR